MKARWMVFAGIVLLGQGALAEKPFSGVVFGIADGEIEILVPAGNPPAEGMVVGVVSEDGTAVGTWRVVRTAENSVFARPVEVSGTLELGQKVVSGQAAPKPEAVVQTPAASASGTVPPAVSPFRQAVVAPPRKEVAPLGAAPLSAEDQKLVDDLGSGNMYRIRTAAKYLYRGRYESPVVVERAAEVLKNSYNNHYKDPVQVDAMAWICKALWVSKDNRHVPLLHDVGRNAKSGKLRKYARKYHDALVRDTQ